MTDRSLHDSASLPGEIPGVRIKIVGVGGAGTNAVDRLKLNCLAHVNLAVVNTDHKSLAASPVDEKLMIGRATTRGLSAGGELEVGRAAAEADRPLLERLVSGVDLLFILAGLGGGTGSGAAPVLAELAAAQGAVVIAFVTLPFSREGSRRRAQAEDTLVQLRQHCGAVVSLPNDLLLQQIADSATVMEAFELADSWMERGVRAVWSMIFQTGLINVDFATLRAAFAYRGGKTLFGIGHGQGPEFVEEALRELELCPLLHLPDQKYVKQADSLIVHLAGGPDLSMAVVNRVMDFVAEKFGSRDNLVLGAAIEGSLRQSLSITVIGTTEVKGPRSFLKTVARTAPATPSLPAEPVEAVEVLSEEPELAPMPLPLNTVPTGAPGARRDQEEFAFTGPHENRGAFDQTDTNLFEGEDLDVPTYLRRGIKIPLETR